jgi:putative protein kinase ArgK-like GTPase of G3E family
MAPAFHILCRTDVWRPGVSQAVSKVRAQQYAASIKALIHETSAKENYGVTELFHRVAEKVRKTVSELAACDMISLLMIQFI